MSNILDRTGATAEDVCVTGTFCGAWVVKSSCSTESIRKHKLATNRGLILF